MRARVHLLQRPNPSTKAIILREMVKTTPGRVSGPSRRLSSNLPATVAHRIEHIVVPANEQNLERLSAAVRSHVLGG